MSKRLIDRLCAAKTAAVHLDELGFQILRLNLNTERPIITVKYTGHCQNLPGCMNGRGFDGGNVYLNYAAPLGLCQVEWRVPGNQLNYQRRH